MTPSQDKPALCLGTVQFGMDYGINNFSGQPTQEQVFDMLDIAVGNSIPYMDTAAAYGNAEERIGNYNLAKKSPQMQVISKLRPNLITQNDRTATRQVIDELHSSLKRLRINKLYGYLLHSPLDFYNHSILAGLKTCRDMGLIDHFGVSIYETEHALDTVKSGLIDMIQIPYNLFDTRLDKTEFFHVAKENGVQVFSRSIFLQGLILMQEEKIPRHLALSVEYLQTVDKIITNYKFNRLEAALFFAYTHPSIDVVIFGIDNVSHLKSNLALLPKSNTFAACREELSAAFSNTSRSIIIPSLWAKTRP